jgi:hypothetical protein
MRRKTLVVIIVIFLLSILITTSATTVVVILLERSATEDKDIRLDLNIEIEEYWEDYEFEIEITNLGNDTVRNDKLESAIISLTLSDDQDEIVWSNISSLKVPTDVSMGNYSMVTDLVPYGSMSHSIQLDTSWNRLNRTAFPPYGNYSVEVEVIIDEKIFVTSTPLVRSPMLEMAISGEIIDGKGHASVSYTNTRDYYVNFSLGAPPLTYTDIFDHQSRRIGGSGDGYIQIVISFVVLPGGTIYSNYTFFNNYLNEKLTPGTYRIISSCMAFPIEMDVQIYFGE